ncbi:MAG: ABC transporter permease subunit [Planctomycetota bacterium]|nr:ABC transporter permease subunit [Planctomycetota bacterium]
MKSLLAVVFVLGCASWLCSNAQAQEKPKVRVGSKSFTESVILGDLLYHLGNQAGADMEHLSELGGTQVLWKALVKGDIDAYVDYTGTIQELLSKLVEPGVEVRTEADMRAAMDKLDIVMTDRVGFNNTYALGMRDAIAEKLGITKISDLRGHPELKFGISDEFMERNDCWRQLPAKYRLPHKDVRTMDHNLAYRGLAHNSIQVTDLYTTDAEIEFYKLRVLEDDKGFFPTYYSVILMRKDLAKRAPKVAEAYLKLENAIDSKAMTGMTAKVRLDRLLEANVAAEFLNEKMNLSIPYQGIGPLAEWKRFLGRFTKTTLEHLFLVAVSLTLAIATAIPLGILSARNEAFGQTILAVVGVIQTLPSMAILVFMIPLFGLGAYPAIAALFFYSLLPIVRNTYAGLTQIPKATIESADVLGLGRRARLRLVELPLALPSILSGVKTAAVINVGTATIGAFIGAGGYGAPILTGIRLSSIPLILQGAVPAALLALIVQYGFSIVERRFVSPGLQSRL